MLQEVEHRNITKQEMTLDSKIRHRLENKYVHYCVLTKYALLVLTWTQLTQIQFTQTDMLL